MRVKVPENIVFYWKDGKLICDDFVAHEQVALSSAAEPLLRWFAEWKELDSLQSLGTNGTGLKLTRLAEQLLSKGILISEGSLGHRDEKKLKNWDAWRQSAKYFHFSIRTRSDTEFLGKQEDRERLEQKAKNEPPPPVYKEYPDASKVALSTPQPVGSEDCGYAKDNGLPDILMRRRTCRSFDPDKAITNDQLSTLLYYAFGATKKVKSFGSSEVLLKTSPSGGARHPVEVYLCVLNVDGVAPSVYHYSVKDHNLERIAEGSTREEIIGMCGDQVWTQDASAILF